jgi:SAM-dependent methyltransferase
VTPEREGRHRLAARQANRRIDAVRRRLLDARCRLRNTVALVAWYGDRLRRHIGPPADAYDGRFWDRHDTGDWVGFARLVLQLFPSRSVVDVGCGQGLQLQGFRDAEPGLALRGFDDSATALARARARGLSVAPFDIVGLSRSQARAFADATGPVDLVLCLEVAEHLPAWHGDKLLDALACGRRLIFSAAHPNQGGSRHVNERAAPYWIGRLAERGFRLSPLDDAFRAEVGRLTLGSWYKANVHAFDRPGDNTRRGASA